MGKMNSLEKITLSPLKEIKTDGGNVLHCLREYEDSFIGFGEAYFSWVNINAIKAWKKHNHMKMNLVVPVGSVRFVFVSDDFKHFREEIIGVDRYSRLEVPPGIWFGFQGIKAPSNLVLNIANIPHSPEEVERSDLSSINFSWEV